MTMKNFRAVDMPRGAAAPAPAPVDPDSVPAVGGETGTVDPLPVGENAPADEPLIDAETFEVPVAVVTDPDAVGQDIVDSFVNEGGAVTDDNAPSV